MLNAFRHLRKEHSILARRTHCFVLCSTPFGIYGRNTPTAHSARQSPGTCSTPFGIYGRNTRPRPTLRDWARGAQRLSASTEGTHGRRIQGCGVGLRAQRLSASTEGTRPLRGTSPTRLSGVLNAFRHLRKEHLTAPVPTPSRSCAQRLSASTEGTPREKYGNTRLRPCSTPFGIYGRNTT